MTKVSFLALAKIFDSDKKAKKKAKKAAQKTQEESKKCVCYFFISTFY